MTKPTLIGIQAQYADRYPTHKRDRRIMSEHLEHTQYSNDELEDAYRYQQQVLAEQTRTVKAAQRANTTAETTNNE